MATHLGNFDRGSALRGPAFAMRSTTINAASTTALQVALNIGLVGASLGSFAEFWCRSPSGIILTSIGASSAVITITGENQFGEVVSEDSSAMGSSTFHSLHCYRKITNLVLKSGAASTGTISVGYSVGSGLRIPLWSKTIPAAAIKAVGIIGATPTYTYDTSRWCLQLSAGAAGEAWVFLDPKFERYF